jgi:(E)-4-hydroxy-3-methylbut-2-enyl-diphosphate synthase
MPIQRHLTHPVKIAHLVLGGDAPIVVQSMTNTPTTDVEATVAQVVELAAAGSELVRLTVNTPDAARAVIDIDDALKKEGCSVPLIGDFHFNGHTLLTDFPETAQRLAKYRINPGNLGRGDRRDRHFEQFIEVAIRNEKPVRIGVNGGSLDPELLAQRKESNAALPNPKSVEALTRDVMVESALMSAQHAESIGLSANQIVLSCKVSRTQDLIALYRELARECQYALHLGLTEAGMGLQGIVTSTAAVAPLLNEGIGDTLRISLTPQPGESRAEEVRVARQILQALELRQFTPHITACPGCGRTDSSEYLNLADRIKNFVETHIETWRVEFPGVENLVIAVMGCVVNGPGESQHADIGISLPGKGESPSAPVYVDGKRVSTLSGSGIAEQFEKMILDYVQTRFSE